MPQLALPVQGKPREQRQARRVGLPEVLLGIESGWLEHAVSAIRRSEERNIRNILPPQCSYLARSSRGPLRFLWRVSLSIKQKKQNCNKKRGLISVDRWTG
jgi:hypothetical protein